MRGLRRRQSRETDNGNAKGQAAVMKCSVLYGVDFGFGQKSSLDRGQTVVFKVQ